MRDWIVGILDLILPRVCAFCGDPSPAGDRVGESVWSGLTICERCQCSLPWIRGPMCNRCGRPFASSAVADHLCGDCIEKPPPFDSVHFLWSYESVVQEIIQRMKYRRMQSLARFLGVLLADHLAERLGRLQPHLIVPIPLHGKRLRMRGFNQAAVMARPLARRLGLRVDVNLLRKIQDTPSQVGLSRSQREENVRGSFSVDHGGRIRGRRLILVDDVFTTGATLKEAARALKRAKASEIHVATLARVT